MEDEPNPNCLNCGTPLAGRFCSECGQKDLGTRVDLRELIGEFLSETFEIEGRLPRTLFSTLFMPGDYLYRFLEGQRRSYSSPLRLYLLGVFLCVLVVGWRGERAVTASLASGDLVMEASDDGQGLNFRSGADVREELRVERLERDSRLLWESMAAPGECDPRDHDLPTWYGECVPEPFDWIDSMDSHPSLECVGDQEGVLGQLGVAVQRLTRGRSEREVAVTLLGFVLEQTPLALSVLMAVFVGLLKLFWWRQPMTVHILLTVTFHALVMYGITLWMLWPTVWMAWLVHGWLQAQALFGLRAAYGGGWPRIFLSYFALGLLWVALAYGALILATVAGLWRISSLL